MAEFIQRERFVPRMCPIGLDEHPTICSAGTCDVCIGNRIRWLEEDRQRLSRNCQHNLDGKREQERRKKDALSQLSAATQEVERLKRLEAAILDDANVVKVVKNCTSPNHTEECCDWCEAREDGIDKYQTLLLEILYAKDQPHAD